MECYQIIDAQELINYLKKQGRDAFNDFDYQLKTNYGFVHELKDGQVVFFNSHFNYKGILFSNKDCFDEVIKKDLFPVENPNKSIFETEAARIKDFHLQADYYRRHLNTILKFDFPDITKDAAQAYLKKVIGRYIKQLTSDKDIIALISVIGELVKQEVEGKWFLEKTYGFYNPLYQPNIVAKNGNVILISSNIQGSIKWRVSSLENIFIDARYRLTKPLKWDKYSKAPRNLIILE